VILEVKAEKRSLSSSSWYLSAQALLLVLITCRVLRPLLIFYLRSIVGAS
jgi:hypothetical protein